jgi:DNA gyrase subunit A
VKGIKLRPGDSVIRMDLVSKKDTYHFVVTENGYGKRSPLSEYKVQRRGGQGMAATKVTAKTGNVVAARVVGDDDTEVIMMSVQGLVTRTEVKSIRKTARATQGVIVMRLNKGDTVCTMATLTAQDEM